MQDSHINDFLLFFFFNVLLPNDLFFVVITNVLRFISHTLFRT